MVHRTLGGIIAGGLFVLPGAMAIMALSYVYAAWGSVPIVVALFASFQPFTTFHTVCLGFGSTGPENRGSASLGVAGLSR